MIRITLSLFALLAATSLNSFAERPNILLILADDMGYSDLGCFGGEIDTPHLDRLAANGLRMRQFYNSGKCEPTRASLMSGQYWHDTGLGVRRGPTLGEVMREAGYRTYALGKWHLRGNPYERGFDRYFGHLSGGTDFFVGNNSFRLDDDPWPRPEDFYATVAYTDFAIDFLEEGRKENPDKPFFMYLAHTAPHAPLQALDEDIALFRERYKVGWDVLYQQRIQRQKELGIMEHHWPVPERPDAIPAWEDLTQAGRAFEAERMAVYAAMVYRMDKGIGRILEKLEEWGELDDTLVIFLSDNGASPFDRVRRGTVGKPGSKFNTGLGWAWLSNAPFRHYKRNQHQGGACTSLVASWPKGISHPGSISDQKGHIVDLMSTFIDLGDGSYPQEFAGERLKPLPGRTLDSLFKGHLREPHNALYLHLFDNWAIIEKDYKLVSAYGWPMELYNISNDRAEVLNLVSEKPKLAARLQGKFDAWFAARNGKLRHNGDDHQYYHLESEDLSPLGGTTGVNLHKEATAP